MNLHFEEACHRYTIDGREKPSVTQVLEAAGLVDLSGIDQEVLRCAADRGTKVHRAGSLLLRGNLDWASISDSIGGYVIALESFLRQSGFTADPERIERPLYSAEHGYCGTPDVVGVYHYGRRATQKVLAVADWKTGMMTAVRYQLAAYARMLGVRHRIAVKLNADGTYRMQWFQPESLPQDFRVFLQALKEHPLAPKGAKA